MKPVKVLLFLVACAMVAVHPAPRLAPGGGAVAAAEPGSDTAVSVSVDAGNRHALRFSNVPGDARLTVQVESDGPIPVSFVAEEKYPDEAPGDALFEGQASGPLAFDVSIPATANYLLVLDNRDGDAVRRVTVDVAIGTGSGQAGTSDTPGGDAADRVARQLGTISKTIRQVFEIDKLEIRLAQCGQVNSFARPGEVILCTELAQHLGQVFDDRQKASDAFLFGLLHEVAHVLLAHWRYPFFDNESIADEFATVLMIMFDKAEEARSQAELFASMPAEKEAELKLSKDMRHPLSIQRARDIMRWIEEPDTFARKWQPMLVRHMRTAFLKRLLSEPQAWAVPSDVEAELARRGQS